MTTASIDFKALMGKIDKDYEDIRATPYGRGRIYYTVYIGERETNIIARSAISAGSNRPRLTFLIRTAQDAQSYSMLYLSEIDIVALLADLESSLFTHIMDCLVKLYLDRINLDIHTVEFKRDDLVSGIKSTSFKATRGIVVIPSYKTNPKVNTPFGYSLDFQSLCDDISLILSTENAEKLKIIIAKYYVLTNILRSPPKDMPVPSEFDGSKELLDIEKIYNKLRFKQEQALDAQAFNSSRYSDYFQNIVK